MPTGPGVESPVTPSLDVDRSTEFFGFGFGNEQYSVILAATAENWAGFCTTGEQNWDAWEILTVTRPDGSTKTTWKSKDLHVLVWENPADICAEPPDYVGTASSIFTDSDVDLSGHGADASGHRVTGSVTGTSGQRYHLQAVFLLTVSPKFNSLDDFVIDWRVQKIQLTARGGD